MLIQKLFLRGWSAADWWREKWHIMLPISATCLTLTQQHEVNAWHVPSLMRFGFLEENITVSSGWCCKEAAFIEWPYVPFGYFLTKEGVTCQAYCMVSVLIWQTWPITVQCILGVMGTTPLKSLQRGHIVLLSTRCVLIRRPEPSATRHWEDLQETMIRLSVHVWLVCSLIELDPPLGNSLRICLLLCSKEKQRVMIPSRHTFARSDVGTDCVAIARSSCWRCYKNVDISI